MHAGFIEWPLLGLTSGTPKATGRHAHIAAHADIRLIIYAAIFIAHYAAPVGHASWQGLAANACIDPTKQPAPSQGAFGQDLEARSALVCRFHFARENAPPNFT